MLRNIFIPLIIVFLLIALQLVVIPFIAVQNVVPNVVLIFLIIFVLRFGQLYGTLFAFVIGIFYDLFSGGLFGSSMFAFTLSVFIAGYFYKDDFLDVIFNLKIFVLVVFLSGTIFAILYSALGISGLTSQSNINIILYGIECGAYTTILSLLIFVIPKEKL